MAAPVTHTAPLKKEERKKRRKKAGFSVVEVPSQKIASSDNNGVVSTLAGINAGRVKHITKQWPTARTPAVGCHAGICGGGRVGGGGKERHGIVISLLIALIRPADGRLIPSAERDAAPATTRRTRTQRGDDARLPPAPLNLLLAGFGSNEDRRRTGSPPAVAAITNGRICLNAALKFAGFYALNRHPEIQPSFHLQPN